MRLSSLGVLITTLTVLANADIIQYVGAPTGLTDGSYYVLPYEVTIDDVPQLVVCFDVYDEVNSGDVWQAELLNLDQAASSGFFPVTTGAFADYQKVAWLDAQTYSTPAQQIGLQYSIWDVFGTYGSTPDSLAYTAAADAEAASGYSGFSFDGVRFIQQSGASASQVETRQAFVYWQAQSNESGALPEPGTILLFSLGGIPLAGMAALVRRRSLNKAAPQ